MASAVSLEESGGSVSVPAFIVEVGITKPLVEIARKLNGGETLTNNELIPDIQE